MTMQTRLWLILRRPTAAIARPNQPASPIPIRINTVFQVPTRAAPFFKDIQASALRQFQGMNTLPNLRRVLQLFHQQNHQ